MTNDFGKQQVTDEELLLASQVLSWSGNRQRSLYRSLQFLTDQLKAEKEYMTFEPVEDIDWEELDADTEAPLEGTLYVRINPHVLIPGRDVVFYDEGPKQTPLRTNVANEEEGLLEVNRWPIGKLTMRPNTRVLDNKRNGIKRWVDRPHPERKEFFNILDPIRSVVWKPVQSVELLPTIFLTDRTRPGTAEQIEFVEKALGTPDFAILEGPPGSGKTTVICELISQYVRQGQRVLLCGCTHESIDNVLERLVDSTNSISREILPVRVGFQQDKMSPKAREFHINRLSHTVRTAARKHLEGLTDRTFSQDQALDALAGDGESVDAYILQSANVVCGTPEAVTKDERFRAAFEVGEPVFDVLIVDEASKLTLEDLMYAGLLARRWILSGDVMQLAPYSDRRQLERMIAQELDIDTDELQVLNDLADEDYDLDDNSQVAEGAAAFVKRLAGLVDTRFQYRMMADTPQYQEADTHIDAAIGHFGIDRETIQTSLAKIEGLKLRSAMEALVVERQESDGFHRQNETAAIDVGMPRAVLKSRSTLLTHQHRMHPEISRLVRDDVYSGMALRDLPDMTARREWAYKRYSSRAMFIDPTHAVSTSRQAGRPVSEKEWIGFETRIAEVELEAFIRWSNQFEPNVNRSVSVICFLNESKHRLRRMVGQLSSSPLNNGRGALGINDQIEIRVDTVDSFQGRESDMVILCIGKNYINSFNGALNRCNVAVTRARYQLVIIGNREVFARRKKGTLLSKLARNVTPGDFLRVEDE